MQGIATAKVSGDMSQPLVSVVIPVWNGEKVLERCLASVMAQTMGDMEIIVVDDGSTDGTRALLERVAARDSRIRPVFRENGGVSQARNTGLEHCRGKYIRFVDADDVLPIGSMEALVRKAENCGSDLVLAAYTEVLGSLRNVRDLGDSEETIQCDELLDRLEKYANSFYYGVLWNKLFRSDLIEKHHVRFVDGLNWGEDFVFVCRYLIGAETISYTREAVYDYRRNPTGMTAHQVLSCILHPWRNSRMKYEIYQEYKNLYVKRGVYDRYRRVLWHYLIRVTLNN